MSELRWVAEHGFAAVGIPATIADPELPPIYDDYYEPYWAACAELGLALLMHAPGHEQAQGFTFEMNTKLAEMAGDGGFEPDKLMEAAMALLGDSKRIRSHWICRLND